MDAVVQGIGQAPGADGAAYSKLIDLGRLDQAFLNFEYGAIGTLPLSIS